MTETVKLSHNTLGACGEYYVGSYLSGMGLVVAFTRGGTAATDLLVTTEDAKKSLSVQVKTGGPATRDFYKRKNENNEWIWRVGKNATGLRNESHWYAMVYVGTWPRMGEPAIPKIFFFPSGVVANGLSKQHPPYEDWFCILDKDAEPFCGETGFRKLVLANWPAEGAANGDAVPKP